jgi:hypothetical protein
MTATEPNPDTPDGGPAFIYRCECGYGPSSTMPPVEEHQGHEISADLAEERDAGPAGDLEPLVGQEYGAIRAGVLNLVASLGSVPLELKR